jgi:CHASE2 domain-containing sensor protein
MMSPEPFPTVLASQSLDRRATPMLVVPARAVEQKLAGALHVRRKVVVIGGSADLSRDTYPTPLGDMPGAVILINSIDSLVHHRQLHHLPRMAEFAIAAVLIVAVSVCFASLQHVWAYLLSCVVTVFALLPLSLVGFHRGYWLDFTLPLIAVQLHHMIAQVEEAIPGLGHDRGGSS